MMPVLSRQGSEPTGPGPSVLPPTSALGLSPQLGQLLPRTVGPVLHRLCYAASITVTFPLNQYTHVPIMIEGERRLVDGPPRRASALIGSGLS